jgi:hypothetical protein
LATLQGLYDAHHPGAGDVVLIDTGTYEGRTVINDDGATIVGSPNGTVLTWASGGWMMELQGASDLVLQDLAFAGGGVWMMDLLSDCENVVGGEAAIRLLGTAGAVVYGNTLADGETGIAIERGFPSVHLGEGDDEGAVPADEWSTAGLVVEGNTIRGMATGISWEDDGGEAEVRDNAVIDCTTGIDVAAAMGGGAIRGNDVSGGTTGLLYEAAARVEGNVFHGATTGAVVVGDLGANGETIPNDIYDNSTGVSLAGTLQLNRVWGNTTGVAGSGTLGGDAHDRANEIFDNAVGVAGFNGEVRFNQIHDNATGVDARGGTTLHHNTIWNSADHGVLVSGASNVEVRSNTIDAATGDAIHLTGGASDVTIAGNILWARGGYDIYVANDSQAGFESDYNDMHASEGGKLVWWTRPFDDLLDWQEDVWAHDLNSIGRTDPNPTWSQPHFADPARGDWRVRGPIGGLAGTSPTVDRGAAGDAYALEPAPHGGWINQGSAGNTPQAAASPATTLQLTFPQLYTDWEHFKPREITWRSFGSPGSSVRIELWQDNAGGPAHLTRPAGGGAVGRPAVGERPVRRGVRGSRGHDDVLRGRRLERRRRPELHAGGDRRQPQHGARRDRAEAEPAQHPADLPDRRG